MKKHIVKAESAKPEHRNKSARANRPADTQEPLAIQLADIRNKRVIQPATILQLQKQIGNTAVQKYLTSRTFKENLVQREEKEEKSFLESWAEAIMANPKALASEIKSRLKNVTTLFSSKKPGEAYFTDLETVYWGYYKLVIDLNNMPEGSKTSEEQIKRFDKYSGIWRKIRTGIVRDNKSRMRRELARAKKAAKALRIQLLYAYHDIYAAGKDPDDVKMGSLDTVKGVAEKVTDLLKGINEADAGITGRTVTPIIPVLDKTLTIVNVITGWKVTKPLAGPAMKDMARLQNALSLANAGLSLSGFGKFLPLFSYIGPLLDGIAKGWGRLVSALSKKNQMWWEAREVMGKDLPHPSAAPGGKPVFSYMKFMFRVTEPPSRPPSGAVLEFFYDNKTMFNKALKQVMGKSWSKVPTRSSWVVLAETNPKKINSWVFYNRDTIWRLIYGRGMRPPKKR